MTCFPQTSTTQYYETFWRLLEYGPSSYSCILLASLAPAAFLAFAPARREAAFRGILAPVAFLGLPGPAGRGAAFFREAAFRGVLAGAAFPRSEVGAFEIAAPPRHTR